MSARQWLVPLTGDQIRLLRSALDSHVYEHANNNGWPVNSGFVLDPRLDRLDSEGPLTEDEQEICASLDEHDALDGLLAEFDVADSEPETEPVAEPTDDWPDVARRIVGDAARLYHARLTELFAVSDVLLDRAVEDAIESIAYEDDRGTFHDAAETWYSRWESGALEDEVRTAICSWSVAAGKLPTFAAPKVAHDGGGQ